MYTFPDKLRLFSFITMVIGAIGLIAGFVSTPKTVEDIKVIMASHDDHHGTSHEAKQVDDKNTSLGEHIGAHHEEAHYKHVLGQLQNKPWAALYVAAFFFFMIALGVLAFYAIQFAAQAGWSPVLFRVMEAITAYLIPGGAVLFLILLLSSLHFNHLFHWMDASLIDPANANYDKLIAGKTAWLNVARFLIFSLIYLGGWIAYRYFAVKFSRKQDENPEGNVWYKKSFKLAAGFLVFFIYTESMMSWDWIMGFDPHWFSTLFGWYVFAGLLVSGVTVIAMLTLFLKSKGYLEFVNNSHIHDLAKFMFGVSIFWTYLWFSQFMLIWYSNIPEEVTYYITRIENYNLPFFGMIAMNFIFPFLILINSDFKRMNWFVVMAGVVILFGHYIDVFNMVMPATVGTSWNIGISEISSLILFLGLFVFVVFTALTKAPLLAKGNPFIQESKHFHY